MPKKLVILTLLLLLTFPCNLLSQPRAAFSADVAKFGTELSSFMGPNLNPEQADNRDLFLMRWDSAAFMMTWSE
jgi:hypothetical protein